LAIAVAEADRDCDALALLLVDMPGVGVEAVTAVLAAWQPGRIAIARYSGDRPPRTGHPIIMSLELWRDALTLAGPDEGARGLLRARHELIDEVVVVGTSTDLDHPADIAAWNARS
jgi:molybdenum cofactor cytidylyltransferase/nicotine blue oxidoreductase